MPSLADQRSFIVWQEEKINTFNYGEVSIKYVLNIFVKELIVFLNKSGYNLGISPIIFANTIASILYKLDYNRFYLIPISNDVNFNDEHYAHFEYICKWEEFWNYWNKMTYNFFDETEIHIQQLAWANINLETSRAYNEYNYMGEENESDDDLVKRNLKNIDPYLLDQMEMNNHYKFTRFDNS